MEEMEKIDLFDRYLKGELSPEEMEDFHRRLEEDPDLEGDWKMYRLIVDGIRETRHAELKDYLKGRARVKKLTYTVSQTWVWASAAAVVLVAVAIFAVQNIHQPGTTAYNTDPEKKADKKELPEAVPETEEPEKQPDLSKAGTEESPLTVMGSEVDTMDVQESELNDSRELNDFSQFDNKISFSPESAKTKEDALPVKVDEMYFDTVLTVTSLSAKKELDKRIAGKDSLDKGGKMDSSFKQANLLLEFWRSPINYKGYKFDGRKVVLFGLQAGADFALKSIVVNEDLGVVKYYIRNNGEFYLLEEDNSFHSYKKETDPRTLQLLKN